MGLVVYLGQVLEVKMGIDLGRADIGMAEELLDPAEVVAGFEEMGGEGMAEQVRIHLRIDALSFCPVIDPRLYRPGRDPPAALADEQGPLFRAGQQRSLLPPGCQSAESVPADRQDALLAALAGNPDRRVADVDVVYIEIRQFRQAKTGGIKEFQDSAIPGDDRAVTLEVEQPCHAIDVQVLRQAFSSLRRPDAFSGIRLYVLLAAHVAEERPDGGKLTLYASCRKSPTVTGRTERPDVLVVHLVPGLHPLGTAPAMESHEIAAV